MGFNMNFDATSKAIHIIATSIDKDAFSDNYKRDTAKCIDMKRRRIKANALSQKIVLRLEDNGFIIKKNINIHNIGLEVSNKIDISMVVPYQPYKMTIYGINK